MSNIQYDDFTKLDLKVGKVVEVSKVQGSNKLLKLKIDIGNEIRQVVAGLGKNYNEEELQNTQVIILTNLEPRKIFGIESQGMLLAAVEEESVALLKPDKEIESGAKVA
jgi:methionyl-tRNA synthetase|tara:strand:- start:901 stop:1227 length:327 start_codon:yes stop_codon:yes gene_type:complete